MRPLYILLIILLSVACNSKNTSNVSEEPHIITSDDQFNFKATLDGKEYALQVSCTNIDKDYFYFKSDKLDHIDNTGDGIVISGYQEGKKLAFTLIDDGKTYSTPKLNVWSKHKNKVMGGGKLYLEGTSKTFEVEFELNCN